MIGTVNYEAWCGEEEIYNGISKYELIKELLDYIENESHIDETEITEEQVNQLDETALNNIGIKLYFAKW